MPTLLLSPRYTIDSRFLANAARRVGWQVMRCTNHQIPTGLDPHDIILYGENYFVEYFAQELNLALIEPQHDFLTTIPYKFVNREITFLHYQDFQPISSPTFIKSADIKSIPAKVYQPNELIPGISEFPPDAPLLLSEPVIWETEYRCFVRERKLQAISIYAHYGELAQNQAGEWVTEYESQLQAIKFIESILENPNLPLQKALVVDIGMIQNRDWSIIELNPAWSSGIYGCDPEGVLATLESAMRVMSS